MRRFLASLLTVLIVASAGSVAANAAGERYTLLALLDADA